jgi:serine phosphatase RsbU (regulator of sigma subunit)
MRSAIMPGSALPPDSFMTKTNTAPSIDEYLRERLMPAEGAIPHIPGIEMFGNSIPVETVGGDLFEYINFQQRYDIDARIQQAQRLSKEFLEPLPPGVPLRNSVDDHVQWLKTMPGYRLEMEAEYRFARSCEQVRVAEELRDLYSTAGVLIVDAQGHGLIAAKIASTVHDTFQALMLTELDRYGRTTPMLLENINLRLAQSVTARNALGIIEKEAAREIATMVYGEVRPGGHFRFANFGHPPPLVFSAEYRKFMNKEAKRRLLRGCWSRGLKRRPLLQTSSPASYEQPKPNSMACVSFKTVSACGFTPAAQCCARSRAGRAYIPPALP